MRKEATKTETKCFENEQEKQSGNKPQIINVQKSDSLMEGTSKALLLYSDFCEQVSLNRTQVVIDSKAKWELNQLLHCECKGTGMNQEQHEKNTTKQT